MRSFEEWVKEVLVEINKANIKNTCKISAKLKEFRELLEENRFEEFRASVGVFEEVLRECLQDEKLRKIYPKDEEIDYWILLKRGLVCVENTVKVDIDRVYEEFGDIPLGRLTTGEYALFTVASILKDDVERDVITLREHCWGEISPSKLLRYMKPYINFLNEELRKRGFVRVSKYTWRKFVVTVDEKKLGELTERLQLEDDEAYVLAVAYKLLKITNPFAKDWKGYNIVDGFKVLDVFDKLHKGRITKEDIEELRRRLLKYEEQIKGLGLNFERLEKIGFRGDE